jgi:hypothetical protein
MTPLTLVRMVFWLFRLLFLFMFKFVVFSHVDKFDSTELVILRSIQIRECTLNLFTMKPVSKPIFRKIMLVPQNTAMGLNNVMHIQLLLFST